MRTSSAKIRDAAKRKAGICYRPGCWVFTPFYLCDEHRADLLARQPNDRLLRKERGVCRDCKEPISPNSVSHCDRHMEVNRMYAARRRSVKKRNRGI